MYIDFGVDIRKIFFTARVVRQQNRLPMAVVESPSLEFLKKCVNVALGDMISDELGSAELIVALILDVFSNLKNSSLYYSLISSRHLKKMKRWQKAFIP